MNHPKMMIGEAAAQAGVSAKAVRLYENKGLIEPPERTAAGYRTYAPDDVATLQFIRQAKTVGLTLDDMDWIVPHQPNGRLLAGMIRALGVSPDIVVAQPPRRRELRQRSRLGLLKRRLAVELGLGLVGRAAEDDDRVLHRGSRSSRVLLES